MFQVERTAAGAGPSAELVGFQRRRATVGASGSRPSSQSFPSPSAPSATPPFSSNAAHSPAFLTTSPGYPFAAAPLPPQPTGEMAGPSHRGVLDSGAGMLGAASPPARLYYHPS